jgi:SAM-dependent methyltransferase
LVIGDNEMTTHDAKPATPTGYVAVAYNYQEKPKTSYPEHLMRHILHDLLGVRRGVVVDVGCGRGDQVRAAAKLGFRAIGLDREALEPTQEHHVCDVTTDRFPLADESADVVISKSVIEHIYYFDMPHYMNEMKRVLKPGGYIVISTPDWKYCWRWFWDAYTHVTPHTHRSLIQCLAVYGYTSVTTYCLIPLPIVWRSRFMKVLSDITCYLPLPRTQNKWLRWSKERQVIAYARKPLSP